jgi:hypothetical protein
MEVDEMNATPFPLYVDHIRKMASNNRNVLVEQGCSDIERVQLRRQTTRKHYDTYTRLVADLNLTPPDLGFLTDTNVPELALYRLYVAYMEDEYLNSIPLDRFDILSRQFMLRSRVRVSLGQMVSAYKTLLIYQMLGAQPTFK